MEQGLVMGEGVRSKYPSAEIGRRHMGGNTAYVRFRTDYVVEDGWSGYEASEKSKTLSEAAYRA
jgi:hypothetical protein